jgi:hypothetical protein
MEELVVIGVIALLALKFISTSATTSAALTLQQSTLGQTAGFASIGEGLLNTFTNDF